MARLWKDNQAATAIEYALIAALIAAALVVAFRNLGGETNGLWGFVGTEVTNAFNSVMVDG